MDNIQSDVQRIEKTVKQKEDHVGMQQQILAKIIRDYYQDYSKTSDFFKMVQNNDKSLFSNNDRLDQTMSGINDLIKSIKKEQDDLITEKDKLQGKIEEVKDAKYELEKRNDYLDNTKAQKEVLIVKALNEKKSYESKLSKIEQEQLSVQNEIDKIDYDSTGSYSLSDLPPKSKAGFSRPILNPYIVTQGYGKTNFSYNYKGGLHNGIDFVAKGDKSILAAAGGKVITGNMGYYGYGRWVAVDHENGLVTIYGHMSSVVVKNGDEVKRGDKIGVMGTTGFSTGPHLHFSIFVKKTFAVVKSSSVGGLLIPTGASLNPNSYL
jgi:murein DD-endopeptidase MepM/ murein hydrolase activator NlpD